VTSKLDHVFQLMVDSKIYRKNRADKYVPLQPTIIGLPSRELFASMKEMAEKYNLPIGFVDAETPFSVRTQLFNMALACQISLCHVNVVSEGLDIGNEFKHLRNYIDLAPVNSGLLFMQRFGRVTRPLKEGEEVGQYICTNRNLERHGYLLEGILPMASMVGAQAAFPNVSDRAAIRLVGLSSLGRLKPTTIKMLDGCTVYMFNITCMQGAKKQEFVAVLHPTKAETLWFEKTSTVTGMVDGKRQMDWGKWQRCNAPSHDLKGFNSAPPTVLTTKQVELWQKHAERLGIEPTQKVNGKNFQLVPLLLNVTRSRT